MLAQLLANQYLVEQLYLLFLVIVCVSIGLKVHKFYSLSMYRGLKYFRNAFLCYASAFGLALVKNWLASMFGVWDPTRGPPVGLESSMMVLFTVLFLVFHFLIALATLFLVYSLFWKQCEDRGVKCLLRKKACKPVFGLYVVAAVVSLLCLFFESGHPLFIPMIGVLILALIKVARLYTQAPVKKRPVLLRYGAVLFLFLCGWIINFFNEFSSFVSAYPHFWLVQDALTAIIFAILWYGAVSTYAKKRGVHD